MINKSVMYIMTYNSNQEDDGIDYTFVLKYPEETPLDDRILWRMSENATNLSEYPIFYSYSKPFNSIDYPHNDQFLRILSGKALNVILDNFKNHGIKYTKVVAIDASISDDHDIRLNLDYDEDIINYSLKNPKFYSAEYYIIDLPVVYDIFDLENSEYKIDSMGDIGWVDKYAFKYNEATYPLFTIPEALGLPFITSELRSLWRGAGIYGTTYLRLDAPYNSHETDVDSISQDKTTSLN